MNSVPTSSNQGPPFSDSQELAIIDELSRLTEKEEEGEKETAAEASPNGASDDGSKSLNERIFARFKAPLIAILNMTDLIRQTDMTEEQESFIQTIEQSASAVLADVNKLIEKARAIRSKTDSDDGTADGAFERLSEIALKAQVFSGMGQIQSSADNSHLKVLVVEDNPVLQLAILKQLFHLGIQADAVSDGEAAIRAAEEKDFDLIFMDCQLPGVDGFEATESIRETESGRTVKIVALTAGYEESVSEKCMASGMDECLIKPARIEDLRKIIERWFQV